jgi:hypothetical protein
MLLLLCFIILVKQLQVLRVNREVLFRARLHNYLLSSALSELLGPQWVSRQLKTDTEEQTQEEVS